jgi:formate dehydrogenase major subunit
VSLRAQIFASFASIPKDCKSRTDSEILADLFLRIRQLYEKDGGRGAEPLLAVDWSYQNQSNRGSERRGGQGHPRRRFTAGKFRRNARRRFHRTSRKPRSYSWSSTADGSMWIYTGVYGPNGNLSQRRDNSDPSGLCVYGNWGFSWPANRRIQYNRASADPEGMPWSESKKYMFWNGQRWTGPDVPDYVPTIPPERATGPCIMNPEGVSRLWVRGMMTDGPFPVHYEPFESPVANPLYPKIKGNPAAGVFKGDMEVFGDAKDFPIVATTYRFVEHFHYWTKGVHMNAVMQPEFFVELSEELAKEKGIRPPVRAPPPNSAKGT